MIPPTPDQESSGFPAVSFQNESSCLPSFPFFYDDLGQLSISLREVTVNASLLNENNISFAILDIADEKKCLRLLQEFRNYEYVKSSLFIFLAP